MAGPVIEIRDLTKKFNGKMVLDRVNLAVEKGQTFAFLGRNGAGKTTTIRTLLGLIKQDGGSVNILGVDPAADPLRVRQIVGYLAEDQTMFGWMRVEQIIRFCAPFYPTWDHTLAAEYVKQFELPLRTKVRHLSKGQNVRLGLLLALAHRPEVIILDDPALGLDPIMRRDFNRDLITHMQAAGRTVFYSSHLLYEVEPVADVVAILHQGRIVRCGATEELRQQVKRIKLSIDAIGRIGRKLTILDGEISAGELILTVDNAEQTIDLLQREEIGHRVVNLNLDEIFEAFVAGRRDIGYELPETEPAAERV